jgi:hypothetical protein
MVNTPQIQMAPPKMEIFPKLDSPQTPDFGSNEKVSSTGESSKTKTGSTLSWLLPLVIITTLVLATSIVYFLKRRFNVPSEVEQPAESAYLVDDGFDDEQGNDGASGSSGKSRAPPPSRRGIPLLFMVGLSKSAAECVIDCVVEGEPIPPQIKYTVELFAPKTLRFTSTPDGSSNTVLCGTHIDMYIKESDQYFGIKNTTGEMMSTTIWGYSLAENEPATFPG